MIRHKLHFWNFIERKCSSLVVYEVQPVQTPGQWSAFIEAVKQEFIPMERVYESQNWLRSMSQKASVPSYINEIRNTVIRIPGISGDRELDKFCSCLKPMVLLERLKSVSENVENATQIALNVDSALYRAGVLSCGYRPEFRSEPEPMDIGNVESRPPLREKAMRNKPSACETNGQKRKDMANNACSVCHKADCRTWKRK